MILVELSPYAYKELLVSCSHVRLFFFISMVTEHIKPTASHHTTVLTASAKKNSTTRSFTRVISIRLLKNLAKDGTLAKSGRFTLLILSHIYALWVTIPFKCR